MRRNPKKEIKKVEKRVKNPVQKKTIFFEINNIRTLCNKKWLYLLEYI